MYQVRIGAGDDKSNVESSTSAGTTPAGSAADMKQMKKTKLC